MGFRLEQEDWPALCRPICGAAPREEFDSTDLAIIDQLQVDANIQLTAMAEKLKMNHKTLAYHYEAHVLRRDLLKGYMVNWLGTRYDYEAEKPVHRKHRFTPGRDLRGRLGPGRESRADENCGAATLCLARGQRATVLLRQDSVPQRGDHRSFGLPRTGGHAFEGEDQVLHDGSSACTVVRLCPSNTTTRRTNGGHSTSPTSFRGSPCWSRRWGARRASWRGPRWAVAQSGAAVSATHCQWSVDTEARQHYAGSGQSDHAVLDFLVESHRKGDRLRILITLSWHLRNKGILYADTHDARYPFRVRSRITFVVYSTNLFSVPPLLSFLQNFPTFAAKAPARGSRRATI